MKRTPLKRKSWMKRSQKPMKKTALKRGISQLKRTKLKQVGTKQAKKLKSYAKKKKEYYEEHPNCERCNSASNLTLHHKMGRGQFLDDERYFMTACMTCHDEIEGNKKQARKDGWILYK